MSRLAAAHRGAVRALQTFVSHAPLQPKVGHGLPPMYQELSALIRQLSLLAAQLHIGGEDLPDEVKGMENEERKVSESYQYPTGVLKSSRPNTKSLLRTFESTVSTLPFTVKIWFCKSCTKEIKPAFLTQKRSLSKEINSNLNDRLLSIDS